jgi:membrane carboxypeptidase/penicillin-binding protein
MKQAEPAGSGDFAGPQDVILVNVDPKTGGLQGSGCPNVIGEAFIEGTEPALRCDEISKQLSVPDQAF